MLTWFYKKFIKKYVKAIEDFDHAIKLKSDYADAYFCRGVAKGSLGRDEEVIEDCDHAIKLNPNHTEAYNNRGVAKGLLGEHEKAIEDFDHAIKLNPDYADAYYYRGKAKSKLGRDEEAIEDFDQAIKLNPDHLTAYYYRGKAKFEINQQRVTDEIIQDFDKARELFNISEKPKNPLFKYIPIVEYQLNSLLNEELYFCDYQELNDPLECFFLEKETWFKECLKEKGITPRILSLTGKSDSKLMYSHYTNNQKGICVEYEVDFEALSNNNFAWGDVRYNDHQDKVESLKDLYMLKNKDWKYEQEFRIVRFDNKEFLKIKIKSITFGYKCGEQSRQIICTLLQDKALKYYEMKAKGNTNDLERIEISEKEVQTYIIKGEIEFFLVLKKLYE